MPLGDGGCWFLLLSAEINWHTDKTKLREEMYSQKLVETKTDEASSALQEDQNKRHLLAQPTQSRKIANVARVIRRRKSAKRGRATVVMMVMMQQRHR